jgi:hypothetical protein
VKTIFEGQTQFVEKGVLEKGGSETGVLGERGIQERGFRKGDSERGFRKGIQKGDSERGFRKGYN